MEQQQHKWKTIANIEIRKHTQTKNSKKWYENWKTKEEENEMSTQNVYCNCVVKRFEVFSIYSQPTATIILRSLLAWLTMKTGVSLLSIIKNRTGVASSAHTLKLCRNVHEHTHGNVRRAKRDGECKHTNAPIHTHTYTCTPVLWCFVLFFVMEFMVVVVACCLPMNHNIRRMNV